MGRISTLASKKRSNQKVVQDSQNKIIQLVVCMYVTLFLKHGNVSQMPFYEKYITISQFYAYREMRMSSSPGIVKFWHLDILKYIRIALRAFSSGGNVLLSLWLLICEKRAHQITDSMSRPPDFILWCEMVGHSVIFIIGCSLFYKKINSILRFLCCTCIIFYGRVFT